MDRQPSSYLPKDASTMVDVLQYYTVRCLEMGASLVDVTEQDDGCFLASIRYEDEHYHSLFIPPHLRGKGLIKNYSHLTFITVKDCGIEDALKKLSIKYKLVEGWFDHEEYRLLQELLFNDTETMMEILHDIVYMMKSGDEWFVIPLIGMRRQYLSQTQ